MLADYERVAVTGGCGFIGRHLVRELVAQNKHVIVLDRTHTNEGNAGGSVEYRTVDIRDRESLVPAMKDCEMMFHLAGNPNGSQSVREPRVHFEDNCLGTYNVLEVAAQVGIRRLLYVSSASSYGIPRSFPMHETHPTDPIVPYGASKLAGERFGVAFWHALGLPFLAARPFCVYGPGDNPAAALTEVNRYLRWHLNHRPIQIVGDKVRKTRDFVHVSDLVAGLLVIADKAETGEIFNIGSGTETSMERLVQSIEKATGRAAEVTEITEIQEDTYRLVGDISNISRLGYVPRVSLDDGVAQLAAELGPHPELPSVDTIFKLGQSAEQLPADQP